MIIPHFYEVKVTWTEQRKGTLSAPSLDTISVATPPEFPKGHPGIWSPEHYFLAAISGCFMTTFLAVAENSGLPFRSIECKATGKLDKADGKYMITEVALEPKLVLLSEADKEKAVKVLDKSEAACLISNSVKSSVRLIPDITVQEQVQH